MSESLFDENDLKSVFGGDTEPKPLEKGPINAPKKEEIVAQKPPTSLSPEPVPVSQEVINSIYPKPEPPPPPPPGTPPQEKSIYPTVNPPQSSQVSEQKPMSVAFQPAQYSYDNFTVLPSEDPPVKKFFKSVFRFVGIFGLIFVISYSIINSGALIKKIHYFFDNDFTAETPPVNNEIPVIPSGQSRLFIPKLNVDAPILWQIDEAEIVKNLENGVAHYKGTALPGEQGNVFITGHSSYYLWAPGEYKDIFALLNKLAAGDKIYITYNGATFTYEVTNSFVVNPDAMEVLNQGTDNTLSLMTCVPVGTNLRRLIVTAKQI